MKEIVKYICEVCGREYTTEEAARKCEETCGGLYMYYTLEIVPSTAKVYFCSQPTSLRSGSTDVGMYKIVEDGYEETNDKFIFHLTRPRHSITEEEARRLLISKAQEWLGSLSKEIDKVMYFQM